MLVEPLVLLAPNHVHANIRNRGLAALGDEPWVTGVVDSALDAAVQLIGENEGFAPKIKHRLVGARNVCELAATEIASAVVPLHAIPQRLHGLIVDGVTAGHRTYNAVVREGRQRDPKLSLLVRELKHIAGGIGVEIEEPGRLSAAS